MVDEMELDAIEDGINRCAFLLRDTDWYVIRQMDNGTPVPDEIRDARDNARRELDDLRVRKAAFMF